MKTIKLILAALTLTLVSCQTDSNIKSESKEKSTSIKKPMDGFPASPESQVTLQNWSQHPYSKWAFRNPGIVPSLMVPRGGEVVHFESDLSNELEEWIVPGSDELTVLEALEGDDTDGFIVIKDGVIRYEKYFGDFKENNVHIWASSTKSLVSMVAGSLIEEGMLDPRNKVVNYLPELKGSAFEKLRVQEVLNMVSALDYSEDYVDMRPGTVHYEYFRRIGLVPAFDLMAQDPIEDNTPRGTLGFLPEFRQHEDKTPGEIFEYHSPNVDVIGLIMSRITNQSLEELISERVWQKIGAEHDAMIMADVAFNPIATGGYMSTLRDFARFGYAVLNDGKINDEQIFSTDFIQQTYQLSKKEFQAGQRSSYRNDINAPSYDKYLDGYKNFWWIHDPEAGIMTARGIHGQAVYIDKSRNVIIATFGSAPTASNATRETHKIKMDAMTYISERI